MQSLAAKPAAQNQLYKPTAAMQQETHTTTDYELAKETPAWVAENIISTAQAELICSRYGVDYQGKTGGQTTVLSKENRRGNGGLSPVF